MVRAFEYSADGLRQTPLNENTLKVPRFFYVHTNLIYKGTGVSEKP